MARQADVHMMGASRGPIGDILDDIRWHHDTVDKALDEKRWEIRHDVAEVDHHY